MIFLALCLAFALGWLLGRRRLAHTLIIASIGAFRDPVWIAGEMYYVLPRDEYLALRGEPRFDWGDAP